LISMRFIMLSYCHLRSRQQKYRRSDEQCMAI